VVSVIIGKVRLAVLFRLIRGGGDVVRVGRCNVFLLPAFFCIILTFSSLLGEK
jgi:hypothetical protein